MRSTFLPVQPLALCAAALLVAACAAPPNTHAAAPPASASPAAPSSVPGMWEFSPPQDTFSPTALLDLRSLNEKVAGESGFVHRSPDGSDFVLGSGKPVRFWAVDEYIQNLPGMEPAQHKARWLAKRGVNMVRVHAALAPTKAGSQITDVNQDEVDHIWKLVAAMKKEGIYTTVSPYWAVSVKIQDSWGVPGGANQSAAALVFWDPTMQKGYRAWLRALYTPKNPYTGIPLSQDPAVGIIQLQNEDSMLFWTIQSVKGPQLDELRTLYGTWLKQKYGSLEAANRAWGGEHPAADAFQEKQGDEFSDGKAGIYIVWYLTRPQKGYLQNRLADQLQFFVDTMRKFNTDTEAYLRNDLGCKQLMNAGNWRPADPVLLMDDERYSYAPNEVMGINRYFTGEHEGPDTGWAIRPGDRFTNATALLDPRGLPMNVAQPVGYPFIIPETEWVAPTAYQSEGPFLTAAYESLTGVDISYFFADGDEPEWQLPFANLPWHPPAGKWAIATPMQLGQFPAAALLYRQGYLRRGAPVVHEERSLTDLWQRRSPLIAEEGGYDPNRDAGDRPPRSAVKTGVNPLAFLVGPVEVKLGGDPAKSRVMDLQPYIDPVHKVVTSDTGEIRLNYDRGMCVIDAPRAQGVTGFLNTVPVIPLKDITVRSGNDYGTVIVVSLDGRPIATSSHLLVQVGTVARPTGWKDQDATWKSQDGKQTFVGKQVTDTGHNPWSIVDTDVTLNVRNRTLTRALLLDANFNPVQDIRVQRTGDSLSVRLPANSMYVSLEGPAPANG